MENIFIFAAAVSVIFCIAKFIEMRFFDKEKEKGLKLIIRDSLLVYVSIICGHFVLEQFAIKQTGGSRITQVFTDNPEF